MGLLTDFAKGFAKGYIEERGVVGTFQDVKSVASNFIGEVKQGYNEAQLEDAQNRWGELINRLQEQISNGNFRLAQQMLNSYYKEYEDGKDFWYYSWDAYILTMWLDSLDYDVPIWEEQRRKAINQINKAQSMANDDASFNDIEETRTKYEEIVSGAQYRREWQALLNEIDRLAEKNKCDEAIMRLEQHYKKHQEEYDSHYFYLMVKLNVIAMENSKSSSFDKYENEAKLLLPLFRSKVENSEERTCYKELKERYEAAVQIHANKQTNNQGNGRKKKLEEEYITEFKACLEDEGDISLKERRLLDKLRDRLGITAERAAELEASCGKSLTTDEQEYLEEYRSCCQDGRLSEKERRLLDKLRNMLGISEERAQELESM